MFDVGRSAGAANADCVIPSFRMPTTALMVYRKDLQAISFLILGVQTKSWQII